MAAKKRGKMSATGTEGADSPPEPIVAAKVPEPNRDYPAELAEEDDLDSKRGRPEFPVAGLVASAGGLDAFKKFFAAMPADSGIAFVLIPHLAPTHSSLMVELVARQTSMPVVEATEGMAVEANRVYIIPPNKNMTIEGGVLRLTGPVERVSWQTSIDFFLRSLADDQMEKAICIILSGTGSHGTLGLKAVKAAGGIALVQDPSTADYPGMPASAIATGLADHVLPVEQMPEVLVKDVRHFLANGGRVIAEVEEAPDHLNQLLALLRARTKFDFRGYRKKMLARRLERRLGLSNFENLADFLAHLRQHPEEVKQLARDLLISVTRFFRDPEAFHYLETEVVAPLLQTKDADTPFRVWVPGCATGEEPYSIAMLLLEHQSLAQNPCRLQIFATDIDEPALEIARRGLYPDEIAADVSPERLARFFTRVDEVHWQVSKQLRETVTFAFQNLIADAPFSRMDVISCRNVLIYLEPDVQRKVLALLHFALKPGGYLFLGPSETIGRQTELFEPVSKKWRIYKRTGPLRAEDLQFPVTQSEPRPALPPSTNRAPVPPKLAELAQNSLLRRFDLACVVINRNYEVLHFAGPTEDYLVQPGGAPTQNLFAMARPGLASKLRVVIRRAIRENSPQRINDAILRRAGEPCRVNIEAEPLHTSKQTTGLLLISFQAQRHPAGESPLDLGARGETDEPDLLHQLERELETTRDDLQNTIEQLESANEELKGSNEEVMSMNEELQSANEELETSKEELHSYNEELSTVNNQLHDKIEEVESATNDMANLLDTTDIPTIFLDGSLRIKLFTPASSRMFRIIATDRGRSIGDIVKRFIDDDLLPEIQQLLRNLIPREKEVRAEDGRWYVRRILPYRTLDNRIDGVVITFVDITERKLTAEGVAQQHAKVVETSAGVLHNREAHLAAILDAAADAIITIDAKGLIQSVNAAAERMFGYAADEMIGQNVKMIMPSPYRGNHDQYLARYQQTGMKHIIGNGREVEGLRKDGSTFPVDLAVSEVNHLHLYTGILRDISHRKQLEREVVEIASLEQRRIGQDLHDSVSQELTALSMLAGDLAETLRTDPLNASDLVERVVQGLHRSRQDLRAVMRGLCPVSVDSEGLMAALSDLASRTQLEGKLSCTFDCPKPVLVEDNLIATHLYLIAHEAVHNAIKHAQCKNIRISVESSEDLTLRVQDDGIGISIPDQPTQGHSGLGLRIMRNRAAIIRATLSFEKVLPAGTMVTCVLDRRSHEP
ncbi:MCP methyltransferase/methylesterase, CheR/CheB with PAS/PAC sensor [Pirellula staleyi DSM 6068]|uniref:Sensor protein FixL n=1 Tax=Pirellula staleyi (strain ATCC 27377 / DSM 6068 / ICPB 4128) TaxID=530564 RepID=D2R949_PIRSD|nr:MCP methyltransferase/methylesterase, CheR/CheB with PAS/PAC sensor [Pirellula staleyi DSM 6068]